MDQNGHHQGIATNPLIAISFAIGVALTLVLVCFFIFINSSAYTTVRQIKAGTDFARSIKMDGYDTKSPIKAETVEEYQKSLEQRLRSLDESSYFNTTDISDTGLGLTAQ